MRCPDCGGKKYHRYYRRNKDNEVIAYHKSSKKFKSIRLNDTHSGYGAFFSSKPHKFKGKYVYQVKLDLTNGLSYVEEPPADIARDISDEIGIDISGLTVGDLVRPTAEESDAPGAHEPGLLRQYMSKELIAEFFLRRGINYFWDDTPRGMQYMVFDPECISIIERRNTFQYPELNRGVWRTKPRRNPWTAEGWKPDENEEDEWAGYEKGPEEELLIVEDLVARVRLDPENQEKWIQLVRAAWDARKLVVIPRTPTGGFPPAVMAAAWMGAGPQNRP